MGVRESFPRQCDTGPLVSLSLLSAARDWGGCSCSCIRNMPLLSSYHPCWLCCQERQELTESRVEKPCLNLFLQNLLLTWICEQQSPEGAFICLV